MRVPIAPGVALAVAALGLAGAMGCSGSGIGSCVSFCEKVISCQGIDAGSNATADCQAGCEMFDAGGRVPCNSSEVYDCLNSLKCYDLFCLPVDGATCTNRAQNCILQFCPHG